MQLVLFFVCLVLGFATLAGIQGLWSWLTSRLTAEQRQRSYRVAKDFPWIAFTMICGLVFLAALGASVVHYAVAPFVGNALRDRTSWGPETAGGMLVLLVYGFWCAPDSPPELSPRGPRGRSLVRPDTKLRSGSHSRLPSKSPAFKPVSRLTPAPRRGRTIRTFRDE